MPVRIKLRIVLKTGGEVITSAYVNSGYETDKPEILLPVGLALKLGLWRNVKEDYARTPIGVGKIHTINDKLKVEVVTEDRKSKTVDVDVVISEFEDEVLISDYLAGELGIAVEDFRRGIWRFRDEPLNKLRKPEKPQHWR